MENASWILRARRLVSHSPDAALPPRRASTAADAFPASPLRYSTLDVPSGRG
jgi:hypothetical protein